MNIPAILLVLFPVCTDAKPVSRPAAEAGTAASRAIDLSDCNGDGVVDRIVGDCRGSVGGVRCGTVSVRDGRTGKVLFTFAGDSTGDRFGWSVAMVGDVDADGTPDFVVGAPLDDPNGNGSGSVSIYSGRDGSQLHRFVGAKAGEQFGYSVAAAGDVDGDGHADIRVGAPFADGTGRSAGRRAGYVRVFSGKDGSVLSTKRGAGPGARLGRRLR